MPAVRLTAVAALAAWGPSAWAQVAGTCEVSLSYAAAVAAPVGSATPVPGLGMLAVAGLGALVAGFAWRHRHQGGLHRMMAVVGMAAAVSLSALGGGSLVNAVRAAGPYEFSNAAGGTVADNTVAYADPAPVLTVTNTSGARIRITANGNAAETGTCAVNSELAPGASCTTQAFACTPPPVVINALSAPVLECRNDIQPPLAEYDINSNQFLGTAFVYAPLMTAEPTFDAPGVITTESYVLNVTVPTYDDPSGFLNNRTELGRGTSTVTSTAPAGYVFAPDNTPTKTWTGDYECENASIIL